MRLALFQTDPILGATDQNREAMRAGLIAADADLAVFPECALTGYGFSSRAAALAVAETLPGPTTEELQALCARTDRHCLFGLLERDGDRVFNAAALVGPHGLVGRYRKMHLLHLGVDRFNDRGDLGFPVFEVADARLGVLICFDLSFPEAARSLKLAGAQVLAVITNWPTEARVSCVHAPPVRAQENHLFVAACNRVGDEAGFTFRGESRVLDCEGRDLVAAGRDVTVIRTEFDPGTADRNRIVYRVGEYELDRIGSRRPEHYQRLVAENDA